MKLFLGAICVICVTQAFAEVQSETEPNYLVSTSILFQRPTMEELAKKPPKTNPKLKDINGIERLIYWDGLRISPSIDKEMAEVRRAIGEEIKSTNNEFFLTEGGFSVQLNVLVKQDENQQILTSLIFDWLPEKDLRVRPSKQSVMAAVAKQILRSDKTLIASLILNDKAQVSNMSVYEFTGVCGTVNIGSLRRKEKSMEIDFDFSVLPDGKVSLLRKSILVGDNEVGEAFDKWIGSCVFNPKYFGGLTYQRQRVKVEYR